MEKLREEELELSKRLIVSMNKNLELNSYKSVEGIKYNLISNLELIKIVKDFIQEAPKHETVEQWISVKDRLPNFAYQGNTTVLFCYGKRNRSVRSGLWNQRVGIFQSHDLREVKLVTHWQPIPTAPDSEGER